MEYDFPNNSEIKISFKTIYTQIYDKFLTKGDLNKLRHKGKSKIYFKDLFNLRKLWQNT